MERKTIIVSPDFTDKKTGEYYGDSTNEITADKLNAIMDEVVYSERYNERLNYCNAYIYTSGNYRVLVSYWTPVAIIDTQKKVCYDLLRINWGYTNTSATHIAKFCDKFIIHTVYRFTDSRR